MHNKGTAKWLHCAVPRFALTFVQQIFDTIIAVAEDLDFELEDVTTNASEVTFQTVLPVPDDSKDFFLASLLSPFSFPLSEETAPQPNDNVAASWHPPKKQLLFTVQQRPELKQTEVCTGCGAVMTQGIGKATNYIANLVRCFFAGDTLL
jgi:hypothetical protein